ncbi:MAG: hypothetical protein ACTSW1_09080 [Candidatus Hodarchaeales archaeon]
MGYKAWFPFISKKKYEELEKDYFDLINKLDEHILELQESNLREIKQKARIEHLENQIELYKELFSDNEKKEKDQSKKTPIKKQKKYMIYHKAYKTRPSDFTIHSNDCQYYRNRIKQPDTKWHTGFYSLKAAVEYIYIYKATRTYGAKIL